MNNIEFKDQIEEIYKLLNKDLYSCILEIQEYRLELKENGNYEVSDRLRNIILSLDSVENVNN